MAKIVITGFWFLVTTNSVKQEIISSEAVAVSGIGVIIQIKSGIADV